MKIIRSGNVPKKTKKFLCDFCGCLFEADSIEYDYIDINPWCDMVAICKCPECRHQAQEIVLDARER